MKSKPMVFLIGLAVLLACACNFSLPDNSTPTLDIIAIQLAQKTIEAQFTETAMLIPVAGGDIEPATETPAVQITSPVITIIPSATPTAIFTVPIVTVSINTNCRSGPNIVYDYLGALLVGEKTEVIGKHPEKNWLLVENPDKDGICWITSQYATITGDISKLPTPILPPFYDWNGTWKFTLFQVAVDKNLTLVQTGLNVEGTFGESGSKITFIGKLSDNGILFSGTEKLEDNPEIYDIYFKMMDNMNQFIGSSDPEFSIITACGVRNNASYPEGCPLP